jgi:hypothetical protein
MRLNLAQGVEFDAAKHEYWYKGSRLSGVTGTISKSLGLKMPQEFVEEHQMEGLHVHKAIQNWIESGYPESVHTGVRWLIETWAVERPPGTAALYSEVLVSDFKRYASAIDIIQEMPDNSFAIYDVKKGSLKREYVTWQLSIYRYFVKKYTGREVSSCTCICMKDREYYPVFPKPFDKVEKLLYG